MVYHPTLLAQCRARDGISGTTQYRQSLRYTQDYYKGKEGSFQSLIVYCRGCLCLSNIDRV